MSLFDKLVEEALIHQPELAAFKVVVEKELLHYEILRVLSHSGMLKELTFIGGTCLSLCYGVSRLNEDLEFTGGADFTRERWLAMSQLLADSLKTKYGLHIEVSEPQRETGNVSTWKLKVQTRPKRRDFPMQRINIDVCALPSYQTERLLLRNVYGVEMGTSGLFIQAESKAEIFADKLVAFALRPNRIQYRDVWDIVWLTHQGVQPLLGSIGQKLQDRQCEQQTFLTLWKQRLATLDIKLFNHEMQRFLPTRAHQLMEQPDFGAYVVSVLTELGQTLESL